MGKMGAADKNATMVKLRPCPFCGFAGVEMRCKAGEDGFRARYYVLCDWNEGGCGAEGGMRHSVYEAETCWNERRRKWRE